MIAIVAILSLGQCRRHVGSGIEHRRKRLRLGVEEFPFHIAQRLARAVGAKIAQLSGVRRAIQSKAPSFHVLVNATEPLAQE